MLTGQIERKTKRPSARPVTGLAGLTGLTGLAGLVGWIEKSPGQGPWA